MRKGVLLFAIVLSFACAPESSERVGDGDESALHPGRVPILIVAVADEPDQLVPPLSRSPSSAALWPWVLPSLVRIEGDTLGRGKIEADLAVSWQSEDGGRAVRFFLDAGRNWEDTTSVGGADVVESYRLYRDPLLGGGWAKRLDEIVSVESPGDGRGTVLFRFRRPLSRARALQLASLPLISSEQWARTKDRKPALGEPGRPVHAAGPFRIDEWRPGEYMRLARNPFAPAGRVPRCEQLLLRFVPSGKSRAAQLQAGIADYAVDLPAEEVSLLRDESPEIRLARAGACGVGTIVWNLDDPIWSGLALRRALRAALDFESIRLASAGAGGRSLEDACEGLLSDATEGGPAAPGAPPTAFPDGTASSSDSSAAAPVGTASFSDSGAAAPDSTASLSDSATAPDGTAPLSASVAAATDSTTSFPDSVAAAPTGAFGSPDSIATAPDGAAASAGMGTPAADLAYFGPPSLELLYNASNMRCEGMAVEIALELDRLGAACRLLPLSGEECASRIAQRRFQAVLMEWSLPSLDDIGEVYGGGGALNPAGFSDASTDSLIALARSAAADTIPDAWKRVEKRAAAMLPYMFVGRRIRIDGLGPELAGYRRDPAQPYGDLLSLERRKPPLNAEHGRH